MVRVTGLAALAVGCRIEADVGEACAPVYVSEVSFVDREELLPQTGTSADYIEIGVDPGYDGEVDLTGYVLRHTELDTSAILEPLDVLHAPGHGPVHWLLLIANTYDQELTDPSDPPVTALRVGMDFNNDGQQFELLAPRALSFQTCASHVVPKAHENYAWMPDGRGGWCQGEPTPGEPNEECLCDDNPEC